MVFLIPIIHRRQRRIGLINGNNRALSKDLQLFVGDDGGNFNNQIGVRV